MHSKVDSQTWGLDRAELDNAIRRRDDVIRQRDDAIRRRDDAVGRRDDGVRRRDDAVRRRGPMDDVIVILMSAWACIATRSRIAQLRRRGAGVSCTRFNE